MGGLEVCRRIPVSSDCYIIMLTARVEESDRLMGLSAGVVVVLSRCGAHSSDDDSMKTAVWGQVLVPLVC